MSRDFSHIGKYFKEKARQVTNEIDGPILHGAGSTALRDSIYLHIARRGRIVVASDEPHAQVHNEGQEAKIFGRKTFKMPQRQFMGTSETVNKHATRIIDRRLKPVSKIAKSQFDIINGR